MRWRNEHYERCVDRQCIVIGRDAARGIGRLFPQSRLKKGRSFYTAAANLPVQGACADAAMLALAYVDERLFDAGSMAVRSRGCTTRSWSKSASRTPIAPSRSSSRR